MDLAADFVRAAAVASAVLGAIFISWGACFTFVVIFLIALVPRVMDLPRPVDLALGITWLVAAWANVAGWYEASAWVDIAIHFFTTGATAAAIYLLLVRIELVPPLQKRYVRRIALVLLTLALGLVVGVLWEFYEWVAYAAIADNLDPVGYSDTILDLLMDSLGSLLAGSAIALWASQGWGTRRLPLR